MITETERTKEPNLWEGIYFYPDAAPESKFMATVVEGRRTKTIGLFESLEKAVDARNPYTVQPNAGSDCAGERGDQMIRGSISWLTRSTSTRGCCGR